MNAPARPEIKPRPSLADFHPQDVGQIQRGLHHLYEAAFTDGDAHRQAMQDAAWALDVITHAVHEVLYLRRENHHLEARISEQNAELSNLQSEIRAGDETNEATGEHRPLAGEDSDTGASVTSSLRHSVSSSSFPALVAAELGRADETFGPLHSPHQACAVIFEELCELWFEVMRRFRSGPAMLKELTQIAAMCQRAAENLDLLPHQALRSAARERAIETT